MKQKSVTIIGLGTLGGYTAEAVAEIEGIEKIVIIDHDIVEQHNLKNSIYREIDVDTLKALALKEILLNKNSEIQINAIPHMYEEGITKIPKTDLVIDCRDITYSRKKEINVRFYISSRYLIGDFRDKVIYKKKMNGKYILQLTKNDLKQAASIIAMLIYSGSINSLIKNQIVQKYELDYIKQLQDSSYDIIYENHQYGNKFVNLSDKLVPIIDTNKNYPMRLFIGNKLNPIDELTIPINTFNCSHDIINKFLDIIKTQTEFNNFVVSVSNKNIELIPETGAA